ncbi:MAG TPA: AraC family transcriptional regulator [Saprospiraceae bacterium]|nr:AraC family transcriptional regulator [Saprospiraceae bacterium]HMQ83324.1 AraC family transcriptional regulator [Saprospiraceae bacterium]
MKYVYAGEEEYLTAQQPIKVGKGQLLILRQEQVYQARSHARAVQTAGICIDLSDHLVSQKIPGAYNLDLLFEMPIQGQHFLSISQVFARLPATASLSNATLDWTPQLNQIGDDLQALVNLLENIQPYLCTQAKKTSTQRQLMAKLLMVKDYIHQYHLSNFSLHDLSRYAGISPYHLSRLFQICFQQSPFDLQLELRMNTALYRMTQDNCSLSQIAYELGYHDLAAFSNQFKRYYDLSPSEMRKNL